MTGAEGYHGEIRALADDTEQEQLVLADNGKAANDIAAAVQVFKDAVAEITRPLAKAGTDLYEALVNLRAEAVAPATGLHHKAVTSKQVTEELAGRGSEVFDGATNEHAIIARESLRVAADKIDGAVDPLYLAADILRTIESSTTAIYNTIGDCVMRMQAFPESLDNSTGAAKTSAAKFATATGHYTTAHEEMKAVVGET
jgi:hypothetical protein